VCPAFVLRGSVPLAQMGFAIHAEQMKTLEEARRNTAASRETNDAVEDLRAPRTFRYEALA